MHLDTPVMVVKRLGSFPGSFSHSIPVRCKHPSWPAARTRAGIPLQEASREEGGAWLLASQPPGGRVLFGPLVFLLVRTKKTLALDVI